MQRRAFVGALAGASLLAGCVSTPGGTATEPSPASDSPTPTPSPTSAADDAIRIEVVNEDDAETTVDLRLSHGERVLLDRQVTVPGGERTAVDSGIRTPGEYELGAFVVGGPDLAFESTVPVEEYDLRHGADVLLFVDGERISMGVEE